MKPIQRTYLHFDSAVTNEAARLIATDPVTVARHSFYPFITYNVITQKIRKGATGGVEIKPPKTRPISYAAQKDAHIFAHYSSLLVEKYEGELRRRGLGEVITAFRSMANRRNIHFANDAFEFIKTAGGCFVLALDVSDYFGTIDHGQLKVPWSRLLGVDRLPEDHYAVYRAITRYCQVDRLALCEVLGLNPNRPRADGRHRYCTPKEFRELVRGGGLCTVNTSGRGIPQGSPISAVLSNLYLLEFDTAVNAFAVSNGGLYRRYCDDLLLVLPTAELREQARILIGDFLAKLGLVAHPEKTESIDFVRNAPRIVASKPLNYLGFTFDGTHKRIRPASIARYYKKMRAGVARAKITAHHVAAKEKRAPTPLRRRQLHLRYSYLGRHNFVSYAIDAARIMDDDGIKRQVKAHWKRLQQLIGESDEQALTFPQETST